MRSENILSISSKKEVEPRRVRKKGHGALVTLGGPENVLRQESFMLGVAGDGDTLKRKSY